MDPADVITELRVSGLRSLENVRLPLSGLTVLIGENGVGKSGLVEACELLRRIATEGNFFQDIYGVFGGPDAFLRHGVSELRMGATIGRAANALHYDVTFAKSGVRLGVVEERLTTSDLAAAPILHRTGDVAVTSKGKLSFDDQRLALQHVGAGFDDRITRARQSIANIDVHLPFEVTARWGQQLLSRPSPMRDVAVLEPVKGLSRFGRNIASAFHALKNRSRSEWEETMDFVRLGLGPEVDSINVSVGGGGQVTLSLKYVGREEELPASALADGTLAFLAFVVLFRLNADRSLLVFDEPELHLHPDLLARVMGFFEAIAETRPVLLATQSDRLLDSLSAADEQVVLCTLDENGATQLRRPEADALKEWLDEYRGLGDLRAAGHAASVFHDRAKA